MSLSLGTDIYQSKKLNLLFRFNILTCSNVTLASILELLESYIYLFLKFIFPY